MPKSAKKTAAALTREDIEGIVREMCLCSIRADEQTARMNEVIAAAREAHEPEIAAHAAQWKELFSIVKAWADVHREEFAGVKSIEMVHGTIGYRLGQLQVSPVKGMTWDKVTEVLQRLMPAYIRVKTEPDKQGLIALGDENLGTLGLERTQQERFYVEPKKDSVNLEAAV